VNQTEARGASADNNPTAATVQTSAFWEAAPAYDTPAFWALALRQPGERDGFGRVLLVIGFGATGPIRCTREYGEHRQGMLV
jgi:hypothetical protein